MPLSGCLGSDEGGNEWGGVANYQVDATWSIIELDANSQYYNDQESVLFELNTAEFEDQIEQLGGHVVGYNLFINAPTDDETGGGFFCSGNEQNVDDDVRARSQKDDWSLTSDGFAPGSRVDNVTWHNQSLLDAEVIQGLSEKEIYDQLAFGEKALGEFQFEITVGANAHQSTLCSHSDNGETVETVFSILVLDFTIQTTDSDGNVISSNSEGDTAISIIFIAPWFVGIFFVIYYISTRREEFQLGLALEEEHEQAEAASSNQEGETLTDSYRARVLTLCALYVAQGIPWGFITVTFVTYLAVEGVAAKDLAYLLTLGTLPWSLKFLWGPVIDRFQYREMGRRRPWILGAQMGMIVVLSSVLFIQDPAGDIKLIARIFLVYNIFTALQDVSTDALAVDVLKPHELEKVNSYMFTSKTIGGIIGGAGLGTIIGFVGIKGAILLQIPILIIIMLVPLKMRERPGEKYFPWSPSSQEFVEEDTGEQQSFAEILGKIKTALSLRSAQLGIVASLVMSLALFLIPILPILFVNELGWPEEKFNATKGGIMLVVTMLGYIAGGQLGKIFGGKSVIIYSAITTAMLSVIWGLGQGLWDNSIFMMTIWTLHTFVWSLATINLYSLMMMITWGEVGGTQFTGYMAMMNLSAVIGYQLTSPLSNTFDYQTLFYIAALLETLVILAVIYIDPEETRNTLGDGNSIINQDLV